MLNRQVYCVQVDPWESWKGGAKDKSGRLLLSDSLFSLFKLFYLFYNFLVYLYSSMDHLIYYLTLTFCIWKYGIYPRAASGLWKGWSKHVSALAFTLLAQMLNRQVYLVGGQIPTCATWKQSFQAGRSSARFEWLLLVWSKCRSRTVEKSQV